MNQQLWILPVTFVFLASSLIWLLIGCRGVWWLKLLMMGITGGLSIAEWKSIDDVFGYPKVTEVKDFGDKGATLYHMIVEEPKAIYLWMKLDGDKEVRSYQIPYSRSIAKQEKSDSDGDPERIQFKARKTRPPGEQSGSDSDDVSNSGGSYEIYVLPPPIVPEKIKAK